MKCAKPPNPTPQKLKPGIAPGFFLLYKIALQTDAVHNNRTQVIDFMERETRLELATPTLARFSRAYYYSVL